MKVSLITLTFFLLISCARQDFKNDLKVPVVLKEYAAEQQKLKEAKMASH